MTKLSKRNKAIREQVEPGKVYAVDEALALLKELSKVKFTESVDVAVRLGVDPKKSDQNVRGSSVLPNGTGKSVRVAVFTQGDNVDKALEAGADVVGMDDLGLYRIGWYFYSRLVTTFRWFDYQQGFPDRCH